MRCSASRLVAVTAAAAHPALGVQGSASEGRVVEFLRACADPSSSGEDVGPEIGAGRNAGAPESPGKGRAASETTGSERDTRRKTGLRAGTARKEEPRENSSKGRAASDTTRSEPNTRGRAGLRGDKRTTPSHDAGKQLPTPAGTASAPALAQPTEESPVALPHFDKRKFKHVVLENGLEVLLVQDELKRAEAQIAIAVDVGLLNSPVDIPGLSHLLEHVLLYRQKNNLRQRVSDFGGDMLNGRTKLESMSLFASGFAPEGLKYLASAFSGVFFNATFSDGPVAEEVNAVDQEHTQYTDDLPDVVGSLLHRKSVQEGNPMSRYWMGDKHTLLDEPRSRGVNVAERLRKHYNEFYCPRNARLVVVSPFPLEETEQIARKNFAFARECAQPPERETLESRAGGQESKEGAVRPPAALQQPEHNRVAEHMAQAPTACPVAQGPASHISRYRPPAAAKQEKGWTEAFPKETMGKIIVVPDPPRDLVEISKEEVQLFFPLRIPDFRHVGGGVLTYYLESLFGDVGPKSISTVLRSEALVHHLSWGYVATRAGSYLIVGLTLSENLERKPERKALLWAILVQWLYQLRTQSRDQLQKYVESIEQKMAVDFKWGNGFGGESAATMAERLLLLGPREVVRCGGKISPCVVGALLEALTADNMNIGYATPRDVNELGPAILDVLPRLQHFMPQYPTAKLSQEIVAVKDQNGIPQHFPDLDLYYYKQQPDLETAFVHLGFYLKDVGPVEGGSVDATSDSNDFSLRRQIMAEIRERLVASICELYQHRRRTRAYMSSGFDKDENGKPMTRVGKNGKSMTLRLVSFPDEIEEWMKALTSILLDPLQSPVTKAVFAGDVIDMELKQVFKNVVNDMRNEKWAATGIWTNFDQLLGEAWLAEHVIMQPENYSSLYEYSAAQKELREFVYGRLSPAEGAGGSLTQGEINCMKRKTKGHPFAGNNLGALWDDFGRFVAGESGRLFRMTALSVGNVNEKGAQALTKRMRALLSEPTENGSRYKVALADPVGSGDNSPAPPSQPAAVSRASDAAKATCVAEVPGQDGVLRFNADGGKGIELRLPNPSGDQEEVIRKTWQFGVLATVEEATLLSLLAKPANSMAFSFLRRKHSLGYTAFSKISSYSSAPDVDVMQYVVAVQGTTHNPDQMEPLVDESNKRIRSMIEQMSDQEVGKLVSVRLEELTQPFLDIDDLFRYGLGEIQKDGNRFQSKERRVGYLKKLLKKVAASATGERQANLAGAPRTAVEVSGGTKATEATSFLQQNPTKRERVPAGSSAAAQKSPTDAKATDASGVQALLLDVFDRTLKSPPLVIKVMREEVEAGFDYWGNGTNDACAATLANSG
eukprot:g16120.t1